MNLKKNMLSIPLIVLLIFGVADAQAVADTDQKSDSLKPNIIFIMTDDLGYGDLGVLFQNQRAKDNASGTPREFTPNLDRMAAEGALLPHHYAAAPVCAPSRASFLLGRSQGHANIRDNQFDKALEDNLTVASTLRQAGYATAAIGKWGLQGREGKAPNWTAHPLNRGFDYFLGYIRHGDGHEHYPKEGLYRGKKEVYENRTNIAEDLDKCYTADLWTAAAKRWIVGHKEAQETHRPFFMFLAYDTPHAVLELPTQAYPQGGGLEGGMQWIGKPGQMINTASGEIDSWIHPDYAEATYDDDDDSTTAQQPWPEVYKRYATDTRRIDSAVGDLIQLLKDLDIDDNTLIIFTSDNGPSKESYLEGQNNIPTFFKSYGPFDGIKRDTWEGGLRMPTIARWPGNIPPGRSIETPSISYDWMPTFIEMAGLPAPALSDGVSLLPSLLDQGQQPDSHIYVEYFQGGETPAYDDFLPARRGRKRNQMQMLRLGDTVAVRYDIRDKNDDFEIYDVVKDPQQKNNLAGRPGMADFQKKLKHRALQSRVPNSTAVRPYDNAAVPAVGEAETDVLQSGIVRKTYTGDFPWVPELKTLIASKEGVTELPGANPDSGNDFDALYFQGYIKVPEDGEYTFYLTANGSGLLRIHNAAVIDAGQGYFANTAKSGRIRLKAGLHPFRLYYTKRENRKPNLNFKWSGPHFTKETIPATVFFH
ncbi:MAG TPA: sulfatase-like hydrolase/transferase [Pricia sp.]|nr:sulfatase-like hydrolase/transferase [Pricia sp.]